MSFLIVMMTFGVNAQQRDPFDDFPMPARPKAPPPMQSEVLINVGGSKPRPKADDAEKPDTGALLVKILPASLRTTLGGTVVCRYGVEVENMTKSQLNLLVLVLTWEKFPDNHVTFSFSGVGTAKNKTKTMESVGNLICDSVRGRPGIKVEACRLEGLDDETACAKKLKRV